METQLMSYDLKKELEVFENLTDEQIAEKRTEINSLYSKYDKERIRLKKGFDANAKEFMRPLLELKDRATELYNKLEDERKNEKYEEIKAWFDNEFELGFELDGFLEKIFNDRWLNRTYTMDEVKNDIHASANNVRNDLKVVTSMKLDVERYKEILDLQQLMDEHEEQLRDLDSVFVEYTTLDVEKDKKDLVEKILKENGVIYKWH